MQLVLLMLSQISPAPWAEPLAPVIEPALVEPPRVPESSPSFLQTIGRGAYNGYLLTIGREKGPNCAFEPSCSLYGHEAIEREGLPLGLILFGARLMRGHLNFDRFYRFDGVRLIDPLDETLSWLVGPALEARWYFQLR